MSARRNADHPLDHMSDSLLAKYFLSHLVLVLGGEDKQDLENPNNMELQWGKQPAPEQLDQWLRQLAATHLSL